jgi:single-strand DNA-binding protein|tara:strand:- start:5867 stop:6244 length:378 start_codon:yes stop_codon:yes gene_type:complete
MNTVILRGNLTRDPELRKIDSGDRKISVINFTVAVSREYTKANGVRDKIVSYIPCEAWDSGAELIAESFRKGDLVFVEGSMRNDKWEKDGVKHSTMKVRVNNFSKITKLKKSAATESKEEQPVAF